MLLFVATPIPGTFSVLANNETIATVNLTATDTSAIRPERELTSSESALIRGFLRLGTT